MKADLSEREGDNRLYLKVSLHGVRISAFGLRCNADGDGRRRMEPSTAFRIESF